MLKSEKKTRIFRQGQLFSLDLVISIVAFIMVFIFIVSIWSIYTIRLNENVASEELQLLAFQITDLLMKSRGEPNNWENNPDNVSVIGLHLNPGYLDGNKVNAFLSLDYNKIKEAFNIERFDCDFKVLDTDGNLLNDTGLSPDQSSLEVISVSRFAMIENETRQIVFTLWRE